MVVVGAGRRNLKFGQSRFFVDRFWPVRAGRNQNLTKINDPDDDGRNESKESTSPLYL